MAPPPTPPDDPLRLRQPQQRPQAGLLQRRREDDDGVQRRAHPPGEDVARCAHLLAQVRPRQRGLAVADAAPAHGLGDRRDHLVDPLRRRRVAHQAPLPLCCASRSAASATSAVIAGWLGCTCAASISSASGRGVASHCWAASTWTGRSRLPISSAPDASSSLRPRSPPTGGDLHLDLDDARPLGLHLQHRRGVHDQRQLGEHRRPALVQVDQQFDRPRDGALGVAHREPHRGRADRAALAGQGQPGDDRKPVVRQCVAEHRPRGDLEGDRRPRRGGRPPSDRQCCAWFLSTGSVQRVPP